MYAQVIEAGQNITGEVNLTLAEAQSYKRIEIKLLGGAHVKWGETVTQYESGGQSTHRQIAERREVYVDDTEVLWKSKDSPDGTLGPGTINLPFEMTIPAACPSSYKGKHGDITYMLCGKIVSGQLVQYDKTTQIPIQVVRSVDTNHPYLTAPTQARREGDVGCWCCADGDLRYTASLPRTGFCAGDRVPLTISVANGTSRNDIRFTACIARLTTFRCVGSTKETLDSLVTIHSPLGAIEANAESTWTADNLIIPTGITPTIEGSEIITMQEDLVIAAEVPNFWGFDAQPITLHLKIGTVPINDIK